MAEGYVRIDRGVCADWQRGMCVSAERMYGSQTGLRSAAESDNQFNIS